MIKSEKGSVIVRGEAFDVIFELVNLLHRLIEKNPDLITSVLSAYTDELEEALNTVNSCKFEAIYDLALRFKKDFEDE
jgi:hypothetical protein